MLDGDLDPVAMEFNLSVLIAERDRYRKALERIGRVHGPWRAVVADALGCSVEDLEAARRRRGA